MLTAAGVDLGNLGFPCKVISKLNTQSICVIFSQCACLLGGGIGDHNNVLTKLYVFNFFSIEDCSVIRGPGRDGIIEFT